MRSRSDVSSENCRVYSTGSVWLANVTHTISGVSSESGPCQSTYRCDDPLWVDARWDRIRPPLSIRDADPAGLSNTHRKRLAMTPDGRVHSLVARQGPRSGAT